jgi:hypothetical protein
MANQDTIPGMERGMFFEHYVFDPLPNFTENDLYHIAQLIDIMFDDGVTLPHPHHFNGRSFSPTLGITVVEFADILTAMNIRVSNDILTKLPNTLREHFDESRFCPYDDISLADMLEFFTRFLHLRISTGQFNSLPQRMKRQFIVFTRDGKSWRYGDRIPG